MCWFLRCFRSGSLCFRLVLTGVGGVVGVHDVFRRGSGDAFVYLLVGVAAVPPGELVGGGKDSSFRWYCGALVQLLVALWLLKYFPVPRIRLRGEKGSYAQ